MYNYYNRMYNLIPSHNTANAKGLTLRIIKIVRKVLLPSPVVLLLKDWHYLNRKNDGSRPSSGNRPGPRNSRKLNVHRPERLTFAKITGFIMQLLAARRRKLETVDRSGTKNRSVHIAARPLCDRQTGIVLS